MMGMKKRMKRGGRTMKRGGGMMKKRMKKGGPAKKFPDLSGDGKVTKKDVLMGRGVIPRTAKNNGGIMKQILKKTKRSIAGSQRSGQSENEKREIIRQKTPNVSGAKPPKRTDKAVGGKILSLLRKRQKLKTKKPAGPPSKTNSFGKMGGGMMKKRMKAGGRAGKMGGGMMKKRMKRGGSAK